MVGLFLVFACGGGLLGGSGPASERKAQPGAEAAATGWPLPPPADSSRPVLLTTGKLKAMFFWELSPGGSYALKIVPPAGGSYSLAGIGLYLQPFGRYKAQGQVRLRVVGVAADGSPADDNPLLPPRLIDEQALQALSQPPLALTWPGTRLQVPAAGFFIVLEGVGEAPDEYVVHSPHVVLAGKGYYQIGRRGQPTAAPRQLSTWSIPKLQGARRTTATIGFWMRGGEAPVWRAFPESKQLPLLDVRLE